MAMSTTAAIRIEIPSMSYSEPSAKPPQRADMAADPPTASQVLSSIVCLIDSKSFGT